MSRNPHEQHARHFSYVFGDVKFVSRLGCLFPIPVYSKKITNTHKDGTTFAGKLRLYMRKFGLYGKVSKNREIAAKVAARPLTAIFHPATTVLAADDASCEDVMVLAIPLDEYNAVDDADGSVATKLNDPDYSLSEDGVFDWYYVAHVDTTSGVITLLSAVHLNEAIDEAWRFGRPDAVHKAVTQHRENGNAIGYVKAWTIQENKGDMSDADFAKHLTYRYRLYASHLLPAHTFEYAEQLASDHAETIIRP